MKNKIIIYSILLLLGIVLGAGGYYLLGSNKSSEEHTHVDKDGQLYTCGMHPDIIETEPGDCPICGMKLNPIKSGSKSSAKSKGERKIIYWRAPMNPNEVYDSPGKSQMGMDLVPVYEDEEGASGVVTVDGSTQQSMNVKMEFVKKRELSATVYTNGTLETDERKEFALTTKINGWVEKLYVNYVGQKVSKGQKLVDIYSPELVAAQQEVITALNYKSSVGIQAKNNMLNNAIKKLELFDITKGEIDKLIKTKKIKKYMTLYAPFSGTVLTKNILEGEMIKAGKEILKISDLSKLWLKADIYESELNKVKVGSNVEISFSYRPDKIYNGKVTFIYPTVNSKTRTVTVRVDIANTNNELKPSMFANVVIKGERSKDYPTVPETAVIRSGKENRVILSLGDGKFKPVDVKLGLYANGYYQVLSGVKEGDAIVTSGQFMIDSESSLRSAVKLFSTPKQEKTDSSKMNEEEMKNMEQNSVKREEHNHKEAESIVRSGIINVKQIDKNNDGKIYECPMDWNVLSDNDGRCPVCNMFLKEYTIDEVKANLKQNGFEFK